MCGSATSHSSATMTIAVALSARSIAAGPCLTAPGRAREEDDAFGAARHLVERPDHLRLAPALARGPRDRRPPPLPALLAARPAPAAPVRRLPGAPHARQRLP